MIGFNVGDLLNSLNVVGLAKPSREVIPILGNVYINYGANSHLLVTDMDVQLASRIDISRSDLSGSLLLPLGKLVGICKVHDKSEDGVINIGANNLSIRIGVGRYTFNKVSPDDFPVQVSREDEESLCPSISSPLMKKCVQLVEHAQAINDVRYYLNGIHFEVIDNVMHVVATDGHRLAYFRMDVDMKNTNFTVPKKGVEVLKKALDQEEQVEIKVGNKSIEIVGEQVSARSNLVDCRYPDYRQFFKQKGDLKVLVKRADLVNGLRRAVIILDLKRRAIKLTFDKDKIEIFATNAAGETADDDVPCSMSKNIKLERGFNPEYILDAISVIGSENIEMWIDPNSDSGLVIMGEGDESYAAVVMQMRL